jgi:uncharacterized protein
MNIPIQFSSLRHNRRQKKKLWPKIVIYFSLIFIIAINAYGIYVGNIFYKTAFEPNTNKSLDLYNQNKYTFNERRYLSLQKEDVSVGSKNNYRLYGTYIVNPNKTKNTIILVHGLGGSRYTSLKYIDMYLDKGFNILIYDSRDHGHSGGKNITYGFSEKYDLDRWVSYIYSKNKGGIIGVHGESLGAATAILHSSLNEDNKKVNFYIADSSYSDLKQLFTLRLKEDYKIKNTLAIDFILFYAEKINKLNNQFTFKEASPIENIKDISTPILFIHGENDTFIPKSMSEDLYNLKSTSKSIYIAPNSDHLASFTNNQDAYKAAVYKFIDSVSVKK